MDISQMVRKWSAKPTADRAARVRENQRRHRARTKAYIAQLENEVARMRSRLSEVLERNGSLVAELEQLRDQFEDIPQTTGAKYQDAAVPSSPVPVLCRSPVPRLQAPALLSAVKHPPSFSPVPQDTTPATLESRSTIPATSRMPCPQTRLTPSPPISEAGEDSQTALYSPHADDMPCVRKGIDYTALVAPPRVASLQNFDISTLRTSYSHLAPPCSGESTIPCGTAYDIINHQNYSGHDIKTITHLLKPGFRGPTLEGDDCRVMSSSVFAVLDVISSA